MTHPTTARQIFQTAYESRYTWDENFPGYSADVQLVQPDEVHTGKIRINRDLSVEVTGVADEQVQEGISTQLRDTVTHRKRTSFEQSHGKHEFCLGEQDSDGAIEILVNGDCMGSNYKVRGNEICQVSRILGRMAFIINTHENFDTGSGYLGTRYDAVFRNLKTNEITSILKFEDSYEKIDDYYVMTKQVVQEDKDGASTTTEFAYFNIKLLEAAIV
ncbi:DUF3386 domain-containing protein [Brasilonema octagenarum UFV-E1]|uniref:DUF3386 domain-containing protein n=1 Tax=Brasilonema sennae CENA114 TaxID=415709 RepID=A0A856MBF2_9CYAN|nr:DUF3386 domain-containing protein [Brasilonema sennae]QDL07399.1 DUF3386 domain-containing protein [Brasilonema sennae CENA114]QDL13760.1 DUF3386 domain-containing protein [Brasilonema octagenarum UFV-E1]